MSKSSITCSACGEDNAPASTFCLNCGASLSEPDEAKIISSTSNKKTTVSIDKKILKQKQSIPYLVAVCVLLLFIDLIGDRSVDWAYYPIAPIVLFAILAPYFALRMEKQQA
jgi:hypothetical protein